MFLAKTISHLDKLAKIKTVDIRNEYHVLGVMSGTSLDGLDLAIVKFTRESTESPWAFELQSARTIDYPEEMKQNLADAIHWSGQEREILSQNLGTYIGEQVNAFLKETEAPDFIASHGHTILHQPEKRLTLQIGDGEQIWKVTGIPVINNFREADVLAGGQGAPLVPIGDRDLFSDYHYALNLGGIANISYDHEGKRVAFDICPFNMALNDLVQEIQLPYDDEGRLAREGELDPELLKQLNEIAYLTQAPPKSLGLEDYLEFWRPILKKDKKSIEDKLRTFVEHAATQIGDSIKDNGEIKILVSGGGAYNEFFLERLTEFTDAQVLVPDNRIVDFKEALVFAYLGLMKLEGKPNCLASVTGAPHDISGGNFHGFGTDYQ